VLTQLVEEVKVVALPQRLFPGWAFKWFERNKIIKGKKPLSRSGFFIIHWILAQVIYLKQLLQYQKHSLFYK